jgi:hypothetical protein
VTHRRVEDPAAFEDMRPGYRVRIDVRLIDRGGIERDEQVHLGIEILETIPFVGAGNDETSTTVDANQVGVHSSIAIGTDGLPVISYHGIIGLSLKVARCNDAACAGNDEMIATVDNSESTVGRDSSIAIGADGFPVIVYRDESVGGLKVAKCRTADCNH